jgi:two-component system OmpR family sensor kinase
VTATRPPWRRRALQSLRRPWSGLRRLSVRARLVLLTVLLLAAAVAINNTATLLDVRRPLVDQVDGELRVLASLILVGLDLSAIQDALDRDELRRPDPSTTTDPESPPVAQDLLRDSRGLVSDFYIAFLTPDGQVVLEVRPFPQDGVADPQLPRLDSAAAAARGRQPFYVSDEAGDRPEAWRAIAVPRSGADGAAGTVMAAASMEEVDATVGRVGARLGMVAALTLVVLAVAGWFAVRAGLRPLRRVEETATAIAAGDLSRRVPEVAAPNTEVGRLSAALNGMLAQIETGAAARAESEARMRRFVADVSHELRTPIFGIKGFTELYRMGGLSERADVDRTMSRIESESARLTRLVEDLLLLARLDEPASDGSPPVRLAPMDLRTLAADALHDLRGLDPSRPVTLTGPDGGPPSTAPVLGDEAQLRRVVTNLVGNAVAHTPPGTPVRIGVGTQGTHAVLEVADEGPGLSKEQAGHVFDRFYRADRSRGRERGGGVGLGLAIVQSIVAAHRGHVDLRTELGAGATFRVVLPAATDEPS